MWFFTSRASIAKIQKLEERALRFVHKDSTSDNETLLSKGVLILLAYRHWTMAVEIYKILSGMGSTYLSPLFSKSITPYNLRVQNKFQPLKRPTTFGIKSLAYYGMHFWNILPHDAKGARTMMTSSNRSILPRYWPFVRETHRLPLNSPHKGQWRGALMLSLICALYKRLSKQWWGWWFETPLRSFWLFCFKQF